MQPTDKRKTPATSSSSSSSSSSRQSTPATTATSSTSRQSTPASSSSAFSERDETSTLTTAESSSRRASLPSTLSQHGNVAVKPSTPLVKTELTPVCIRSGLTLAVSADIKKSNLFKFIPNVRPSSSSSILGSSSAALDFVKSESSHLDISSVLAHSLTLKNLQQGGTRQLQELHLRKAQGRDGAFGSRGGSDRRSFSVQAKIQQHLSNIRKKKNGRKSMNMLELSWAEGPGGMLLYSPVTLPYVAKVDDEPEENNNGKIQSSKRPTSRHIDESNRHAASLFDENAGDEFSDSPHQWIVVQFPVVLPALDGVMNDGSSSYCATNIESLPEGRLGKIKIYKSRKVTFNLGDHEFEVNQGSDCNFSQEVACLINGNSELMFLGRCNKRIVVTPCLSKVAAV